MRILFIGDIIGKPGRLAVKAILPEIIGQQDIDFVIANGENCAGGFGINIDIVDALLSYGVDVITGGNHFWDRKEIGVVFEKCDKILRPANYPESVQGNGAGVFNDKHGRKVGVLNLQGRTFMTPIDCPFRTADKEVPELRRKTNVVIVDFHAEATSEKQTLAYYLDGRVAAIIGTHTHVQSADERIFPNKTGYITDVGMTGPYHSVIGMEYPAALHRFITGTPARFKVATKDVRFAAVIVETDHRNGNCLSMERIFVSTDDYAAAEG
ncbi:MAG: TIGR00282 family metallophosphoesterase [candidate division Zixibacteria bacterium]|nr:TIGR00282 family metallophosphoesterase [candidate division Zixibacteria bacterium]